MPRSTTLLLLAILFLTPRLALPQTDDKPDSPTPAPSGPTPAPPDAAPAPAPAASTAGPAPDEVAVARQECSSKAPCPHFSRLVGALGSEQGPEAAEVLGTLGDPRAVGPLVQAAVYGVSEQVLGAARDALRALVRHSAVRDAARLRARTDPDPAVRAAIAEALGGVAGPARTEGAGASEARGESAARAAGAGKPGSPDATRLIYGPTAYGREKGVWSWTIYNIAYWNFDYGLSDHVEIGMQTLPPIGVVAFLPHMKVSARLGEKAAVGVRVFGGIFYPYIENDDDWFVSVFGGAPVLTLGDSDLLLNLSVLVAGFVVSDSDTNASWSVMPNIGFSWRFARRLKLNAELYAPLMADHPVGNGQLWVLLYGLRIFSGSMYGDVSFALPFWPDMGGMMKYIPVGFPLLTFGFQW